MRLAILVGLLIAVGLLFLGLLLGALHKKVELEAERASLQGELESINHAMEPFQVQYKQAEALRSDIGGLRASNARLRRDIVTLMGGDQASQYSQYRALALREVDCLDELDRATRSSRPLDYRQAIRAVLSTHEKLEEGLLSAAWSGALDSGRPSYAHLCRAVDAYRYAAPDGPDTPEERQARWQAGHRESVEARNDLQGNEGETDGFRPEATW